MDNQLKTILDMVTMDIKANRLAFGKQSNREYVREIFILCRRMAARVK